MNKIQKVTQQLYTENFIHFLNIMPEELRDEEKIKKLVEQLNVNLNNKPVMVCICALSFQLSALMTMYENEFNESMNFIKDCIDKSHTENYIM